MPRVWRTILITAAVAFVSAALGVYVGLTLGPSAARRASLDDVMHRELALSAEQDAAIEEIEARYARRKSALEAEMRAATRDIAAAVSEDGSYTPRVNSAVDHFHTTMGELQRATIEHVFEMRAVLSPQQRRKFDEIVRTELLRATEESQ
jgi:Spy/CpxP family protein refolding chaperone